MLEIAVSIFAWMGVVLIQAMVHYKLGERHRHEKEMDEVETDGGDLLVPPSLEDDEGESLDGDEPQVFFQLLSQSGSEMVMSNLSIESLVKEQIEQDEADRELRCIPSSVSKRLHVPIRRSDLQKP